MCPDDTALAALQLLGEVSTLRTFEGGVGIAPDRLCHHEEVSHGGADRDGGVKGGPVHPYISSVPWMRKDGRVRFSCPLCGKREITRRKETGSPGS